MNISNDDNTFTMDPKVKARWITALRSGNIKQTKHKLHRTDGSMCCLGVLSHHAYQAGVVSRVPKLSGVFAYNDQISSLTSDICRWAGLVNDHAITAGGLMPFTDREKRYVYLDDLNDSGFTFDQIADLIECFY